MRRITLLPVIALLAACASNGKPPAARPDAVADLINGRNEKVGRAEFFQTDAGVKIVCDVWSLPPGTHAMHLHETGQCHAPDFKAAKGHFNPFGRKHGLENPDGPHAGDLPNFEVGADGKAHVEVVAALVTLKAGEKNTLWTEAGTCLLVHAGPDDNKSDPAGNAGDRIACGTIVKP